MEGDRENEGGRDTARGDGERKREREGQRHRGGVDVWFPFSLCWQAWRLIGVKPTASKLEIKKAFRERIRQGTGFEAL